MSASTVSGDTDIGLQADSVEQPKAPLPVIQVSDVEAALAAVEAAGDMIVNIGGGITEAAVLTMNNIVRAESGRIGGLRQDDAIIDLGSGPETVDLELAGGAVTFGGGFNYYVSPIVALGLNLKFSAGEFTEIEVDNVTIEDVEIEAVSTRLNFGITIYPMR